MSKEWFWLAAAISNIHSGVGGWVGGGWVEAKNNAYFGLSAKSLSVGPSVAISVLQTAFE